MASHVNQTIGSQDWVKVADSPALCMVQSRRSVVYANVSANKPGAADRGFFVTPTGITFPDLSAVGMNIWLRAADASDDVSVLVV